MSTLFIKDQAALIESFGKELNGYTPGEKFDASKWKFPVTLKLDTKKKLIYLLEEEVSAPEEKKETKAEAKATVSTSTSSSKKNTKIFAIVAFAIVAVVIIGVIIYNCVA